MTSVFWSPFPQRIMPPSTTALRSFPFSFFWILGLLSEFLIPHKGNSRDSSSVISAYVLGRAIRVVGGAWIWFPFQALCFGKGMCNFVHWLSGLSCHCNLLSCCSLCLFDLEQSQLFSFRKNLSFFSKLRSSCYKIHGSCFHTSKGLATEDTSKCLAIEGINPSMR